MSRPEDETPADVTEARERKVANEIPADVHDEEAQEDDDAKA